MPPPRLRMLRLKEPSNSPPLLEGNVEMRPADIICSYTQVMTEAGLTPSLFKQSIIPGIFVMRKKNKS